MIWSSIADILEVFSWTYMVAGMVSRRGSGYLPINLIDLKEVGC